MGSLRGRGGIFISYRREETAGQAGRLYDHLSEHFGEDRVFMDIDSIAIGADFTKAVIEAVSGCSILLALIGRHWSAITDTKGIRRIDYPHDFVRVEIETALQRDIRVVPVLVDGAVLPRADDLPAGLRPLIRRQALELSHTGFRSQISRLIAAIDEVAGAGPSQSTPAPKMASGGAVTQQGRWTLERVPQSAKSAFTHMTARLSSGRQAYDITYTWWSRTLIETIKVDGKTAVKGLNLKNNKEYRLSELSSIIGSNVTVRINSSVGAVKGITVTIGDQILRCN